MAQTKRQQILVVEDEQGIRDIIQAALSSEYDILLAVNGEEGVHQAKIYKPQLILLDIRMPGMDGLSALAKLKTYEETRHIPVIMVSVEGDTDALLDSQRSGAADHVIKPFQIDQLREVVHRHLLL